MDQQVGRLGSLLAVIPFYALALVVRPQGCLSVAEGTYAASSQGASCYISDTDWHTCQQDHTQGCWCALNQNRRGHMRDLSNRTVCTNVR